MTTKKQPIPTVEQLQEKVGEHLRSWLETNVDVDATLRQRVFSKLDQHADTIITKLLGFDSRAWGGRWELDHCNGRAGNSAAGDYLRKKLGPLVEEWLDDQAGKLPKLTQEAVKSIRDEYLSMYRRALTDRLYQLAKSRADEAAQKIMVDIEARVHAASETTAMLLPGEGEPR